VLLLGVPRLGFSRLATMSGDYVRRRRRTGTGGGASGQAGEELCRPGAHSRDGEQGEDR
jgi:hypothetical protein